MRHIIKGVLLTLAVLGAIVAISVIAGCKGPGQQANDIRDSIYGTTAEIVTDVNKAQTSIASADRKIMTATTQPANPPSTVTLLTGAHTDLKNAQSDLAPIVPATVAINAKAAEAAVVTNKVEKKLETERSSFFSYKQRLIFYIFAALAPIVGVLVFILKTNGGGPIFAAISSLLMPAIRVVWSAIKFGAKVVYHVFTLGLAKFADLVNHHYDVQQAAKNASTTVTKPS